MYSNGVFVSKTLDNYISGNKKFANTSYSSLMIPESIGNVAQVLCTRLCVQLGGPPPGSTVMGLPSVECLAAAGVVIALKLFCGLNGLHEHQLSFVADGVEEEGDAGPHGQSEANSLCHLFSWHSWHR